MPLLDVQNLTVSFPTKSGPVHAVKDVSLSIERGEILGLVGESGCGKTSFSRALMRLIPASAGRVILDGTDLTALDAKALRQRRPDFQMVFQDPYASLNPRLTIHTTLAEALRTRRPLTTAELDGEVSRLLERVGLDPRAARKYPHEFSGGQRQRVAIARALAPEPKLIIADEPVSALDVSIQSQILNLLRQLTRDLGLTMLFISHDLHVVRYLAGRIAVMNAGQIVETGPTSTVMDSPQHPYTQRLLAAAPRIDLDAIRSRLTAKGAA